MNKLVQAIGAAVFSAAMFCGTAHAGFFVGSISAQFENPVLIGDTIGGPGNRFYDNTHSANFEESSNGPVAAFTWGSPGQSILTFFPNQSVQTFDGQPFSFGTMTFYNGTSDLNSLVFGVDLVLTFNGMPQVDTLNLHLGIGTTYNVASAALSADFISIPGIGNSFSVFEGVSASANVEGSIVGDPMFVPSGFSILDSFGIYTGDPNVNPYNPNLLETFNNAGFVGGFVGPTPSAAVPEPASCILFGIGVLGMIGLARRRSSSAS